MELLLGWRRLGPAGPALTSRQLAVWVSCQPGLHIQAGLVHQSRPVQLPRAQAVLPGYFTDPADSQPRGVLLGRLQAAGYTAGTAKATWQQHGALDRVHQRPGRPALATTTGCGAAAPSRLATCHPPGDPPDSRTHDVTWGTGRCQPPVPQGSSPC